MLTPVIKKIQNDTHFAHSVAIVEMKNLYLFKGWMSFAITLDCKVHRTITIKREAQSASASQVFQFILDVSNKGRDVSHLCCLER